MKSVGMAGLDVAHAGARLAVRNDHGSKEYVYHPMACHPCIDVSRGKRGKSSDALGSSSIGSLQLISSGRIEFSPRHYPVERSRHPRELGWCRPQASLPRSWPTPELRIPNAAVQTRIVSKARNWVGFSQICAVFQRDNLRRHFLVRVLPLQPASPVSAGHVRFAAIHATFRTVSEL
jgi:hypothetical protein